MKKKLTKAIQANLPQLYDIDGEIISRRSIANKIYDSIKGIEKLDLEPFTMYIPLECSKCSIYNTGHKMGCTYKIFSDEYHLEHPAPDNCPLEY